VNNILKPFFREIFLKTAGSFSKPARGIHILNSHFATRFEPNYEVFCEFLQYLHIHCEFIKIEDSIDMIKHNQNTKDSLVSFTFDDGFEECYSIIAPALEEFNTNAAFFINGNFIDGNSEYILNFTNNIIKTPGKLPMNFVQIKDLHRRGHIIGSHTLDHVNMNSHNLELIEFQIVENKRLIENWTNYSCEFFAFPYGQFKHINNDSLGLVEKYHKYIFSATNYKKYYSFNGRVINRRHMESEWPKPYINYFLSKTKEY